MRIWRRLALVPPTLVGITLATFLVVHLAPGDPATFAAGTARGATPESLAALRAEYGLDRPLGARYLDWLGRSLVLDFGRSTSDGQPVRAAIFEALPATAALALAASALAWGLAVPLGAWLAWTERQRRRGRAGGGAAARAVAALLALVYALPQAAIGLLLIAVGAPYGRSAGAFLAAACVLAAPLGVRLVRHQRGALAQALSSDYVLTARALGAPPVRELTHALRNALLPTVTLLGAELPLLLSGSIVVEQVFGVRGLGLLALDAVLARDYPILLGLTTLGALVTLGGVLAADLAYGLLDPRLRGRSVA